MTAFLTPLDVRFLAHTPILRRHRDSAATLAVYRSYSRGGSETTPKRHRAPCTVLDARDGHRYTAVAKTETLAFAYFCERRTYDPRAWLCQRRRTGRLTALEKGAGWRTISWYYTAMEYANFRVSMRSPALSGASPICSGAITSSLSTARSSCRSPCSGVSTVFSTPPGNRC